MNNRQVKPHFVRSTQKEKTTIKGNTNPLLCLMLNRVVKKSLIEYLAVIKQFGNKKWKDVNKLVSALKRIQTSSKARNWKELYYRGVLKRKNQKILNKLSFTSIKIQKNLLSQAFNKVNLFQRGKERKRVKKLQYSRQNIFTAALKKITANKLRKTFSSIASYSKQKTQFSKRIPIFCCILSKIKDKKMLKCWQNLNKLPLRHQNEDQQKLRKKIVQIQKELQEKQKKCKQLEKAIEKEEADEKSIRRRARSQTNLKDQGNKRSSSQEKDEKRSDYGNFSVGSILNGSFLTFKSGGSSHQDSLNGDCFCKYRQKYNYYKCESNSLKKQLEIVKKQLQVTKDLNEHLQNQFTDCMMVEENNLEVDRLRRELKEVKKERESLKEKIGKYQKYVSNLKYEFKFKMQNLYRNIKKNQ